LEGGNGAFQVSFVYDNNRPWHCSGTLVGRSMVVTSAQRRPTRPHPMLQSP
jgi:hypothetical protein